MRSSRTLRVVCRSCDAQLAIERAELERGCIRPTAAGGVCGGKLDDVRRFTGGRTRDDRRLATCSACGAARYVSTADGNGARAAELRRPVRLEGDGARRIHPVGAVLCHGHAWIDVDATSEPCALCAEVVRVPSFEALRLEEDRQSYSTATHVEPATVLLEVPAGSVVCRRHYTWKARARRDGARR